jgi:hypothetical protein
MAVRAKNARGKYVDRLQGGAECEFYAMPTADLAAILLDLAQRVRLTALRKSPKRPQKSCGKRPSTPKKGHVSTAKLLMNRKAQMATP